MASAPPPDAAVSRFVGPTGSAPGRAVLFRGHRRPRGQRAARDHRAPRSGLSFPELRGCFLRAAGHVPHPEDHMYDMIEYPSTPDSEDEIARALQDAINRRD
ncbi:hypothetical protein GCM10007079_42760 [Nocardiopsis terrae]|nr:hypothetical protein GCM10007079_42760 [Nocardiopsis terrae]